jgi:hypothetical protein
VPFVTFQGTYGDSACFRPTAFTVLELKATQSLMGLLPSRTRSSANYCGGCTDLSGSTRCGRIQRTVFCIGSSRGPLLGLHCDLCLLSPSGLQVDPKIRIHVILSNWVPNIIRRLMDNMKLLLICILRVLLSQYFFFINVYVVLFLFNNVIYVFLLYDYVYV